MLEEYFCEICNKTMDARGKSGHLRSKKHLLNANRLEKKKETLNPKRTPPEEEMEEQEEEEEQEEKMFSNGGNIKIVTEGETEKTKGTTDRILDFIFSPQVAPVTMAILDNIGNMLNNKSQENTKEEDGMLVETVSGAMIKVKNKEF